MPKTCANDKCACDEGCACCPKDKSRAHHACVANLEMRGRDVVDAVLMVLPVALHVDVRVVIANV